MKLKKLVAIIAAALVLATTTASITACGGGETINGDTVISTQQEVMTPDGTWKVVEYTIDGTDGIAAAGLLGYEDSMYFVFNNGTVTASMPGMSESWTYTYKDGIIVLEGMPLKLKDNKIEYHDENNHLVLEKESNSTDVKDFNSVIEANPVVGSWTVVSMTNNGEEVLNGYDNVTAVFTKDMMILSYDGEEDFVEYTYSNGTINAEGVIGTVNGDTITFQQDGQAMVMKRSGTTSGPTVSANLTSIDGTTWRITEMTTEGVDATPTLDSMGGAVIKFIDGTVYMEMLDQSEVIGSYTYENGHLAIEGETVSINGDTITYQSGSDKLVMKKN